MKRILFLLFTHLFIMQQEVLSQGLPQKDIENLSAYIKGLQYTDSKQPASFGAFKINQGYGCVDASGNKYWQVEPYLVNLGLKGFLKSLEGKRFVMVKDWLNWYTRHIDAKGIILDHWYKGDGTGETTCPASKDISCKHADSHDSYAATFLSLCYSYYEASADKSWFSKDAIIKLELIGNLLVDILQQPDGLTWAKTDYHIKYLMDNAEVYDGLMALSRIESQVYKNPSKARKYEDAAVKAKNGINKVLFDSKKSLYILSIDEKGTPQYANLSVWYPGTTALMWPQIFNVEDRVFTSKNYLFPIAQVELNKAPALKQNPGYN